MDLDAERTSIFRAVNRAAVEALDAEPRGFSDADRTLQDQPVASERPTVIPPSRRVQAPRPSGASSSRMPKVALPKTAPKPVDGTQEVQIQDVLEEVLVPGGDAVRTLPRRSVSSADATQALEATSKPARAEKVFAAPPAPRVEGTEEIAADDILAVSAVALASAARPVTKRTSGTEEIAADDILMEVPASIAPFAVDVPVEWPVLPQMDRAPQIFDARFDDVETSGEMAARVLGRDANKRRKILFASAGGAAVALLVVIGLALRAPAPSQETAKVQAATPSLEEKRLAEVPPPPPAEEAPAREQPAAPPVAAAAPAPAVPWGATGSWTAKASAPARATAHAASRGASSSAPSGAPLTSSATPGHGGRTGHLHANGSAHDEMLFVDGASVGRGDVDIACGMHNISIGLGKKARLRVPCGGTLNVGR